MIPDFFSLNSLLTFLWGLYASFSFHASRYMWSKIRFSGSLSSAKSMSSLRATESKVLLGYVKPYHRRRNLLVRLP